MNAKYIVRALWWSGRVLTSDFNRRQTAEQAMKLWTQRKQYTAVAVELWVTGPTKSTLVSQRHLTY